MLSFPTLRLRILYEDNHIIAVYKPAGILAQANEKGVENLLDRVKKFIKDRDKKPGNVYVGLIHRLDRPVSGIIVFAKTSKGASRLSEQFRRRTVQKTYTALVEGITEKAGELIHFLKKDPEKIIAIVENKKKNDYQRAELSYRTIFSANGYSLMAINLKTGRFNQIRAQLSHIGYPIVGDDKYGAKTKLKKGEIALCSTEIKFKKTTLDEVVELKVDYPNEWSRFLN